MRDRLFDLNGKVALITGASSGMGRAIAEAMAEQGATVVLSSNDEQGCKQVTEDLNEKNYAAHYIVCDVAKKEEIENLYNGTISRAGKIDILVSCVGVAIPGSLLDINAEDFEKTFAINLQSAIYLTKLVIPQMAERNDGVLIYLSSISGVRGNKSIGLYGLSKAALIQLARNLAVEWGPKNIRANTISPGVIETGFAKPMLNDEEVMKKRVALTPLRRVGQPDEVAGVAVMLASKAGGFITGQNIIVDGGTVISDGN
ncbi:MAG: SDR family oxidoreductase [Flavisolibacter sp.]|nr:SDR family oxidoreductase [Flavisolibacter sp.]